jgi:hypothetical protein
MGKVRTISRKGSARRILRDWTPEIDASVLLPRVRSSTFCQTLF